MAKKGDLLGIIGLAFSGLAVSLPLIPFGYMGQYAMLPVGFFGGFSGLLGLVLCAVQRNKNPTSIAAVGISLGMMGIFIGLIVFVLNLIRPWFYY